MTAEGARGLPKVPAGFGAFNNAGSARLSLPAVMRGHGRETVDRLNRKFDFERKFSCRPGACFQGGLALAAKKEVS